MHMRRATPLGAVLLTRGVVTGVPRRLAASGRVKPDADCAPPAPSASSMKPLSQLQQDIVNDPARAKLIQAVAGSGKTEVLVHIALKAAREGTNVLFVTKVSSVTFEIMNRLKAHLKIAGFAKSGNHYYTRLSTGAVIEGGLVTAFPQKATVDTGGELVDASIVNVACTRSERYLAVGVPASGASFYLNPTLPGGKAFEPDLPVVASWQAAQLPKDSFFRKLAEELHNLPGVPDPDELQLNQPRPTLKSGPRKLTLSVSTDIAHGFDHPTDLFPELFKRTSIHSHKFGTPFNFKCDFSLPPSTSGDGPPCDTVADTLGAVDEVIGHMANLLLERLHCQRVGDVDGLRAKFDYLTKTTQHHYTSSELLNVSADQRLNDLVEEGSQDGEWRDVLQAAKAAERQPGFNYGSKMECNSVAGQPRYHRPLSNEVKDEVQQLIDQEAPKYILPPYCSTDSFQASVEDYLSDKPCEELHPSSMWHMAVADQLLSQELRRPVLDLCWDLLAKESWQSLISNAVDFLDMLHGEAGLGSGESDMVPPTLIFNCNLSLLAIGGINAHSDIISPRSKHLIEIKTPMNPFKRNGGGVGKALAVKNENPWWIQALTYAVLCPVSIPVHKVSVVNLTAGEMFSLNVLNTEHPCPEGIPVPMRKAVLKKIFAKNKFSDMMKKLLFAKALERYGANADDAGGGNAEAGDGEAVD